MKQYKHATSVLFSLALCAFAIGSTEFISVGLLPMISKDLGVSISTSGLTVSLYALGVVFGAPILTAITGKFDRKFLLLATMSIFIMCNTLAFLSFNFSMLLVGRIVSSLAHGIFMSIASTIAADVVAKNKQASAIAFMFSGLTVATVTGVPLGTWLGDVAGWRFAFLAITLLGCLAAIAIYIVVPVGLTKPEIAKLQDIGLLFNSKKILTMFLVTALGYGGTFVVYTYVSPILEKMGYDTSAIVLILVGYGIMIAIGNTIGGKLSNHNPLKALFVMFLLQTLTLVILFFTQSWAILGLINIFILGLFAFMNVPGLQLQVLNFSKTDAPKSIGIASALNISAFNIGIAFGAFLGGLINDYLGLNFTPIFASLMVFLATLFTFVLYSKYKTSGYSI